MRPRLELKEQASRYQVEGEVGRFRFSLYEAVDEAGDAVAPAVEASLVDGEAGVA